MLTSLRSTNSKFSRSPRRLFRAPVWIRVLLLFIIVTGVTSTASFEVAGRAAPRTASAVQGRSLQSALDAAVIAGDFLPKEVVVTLVAVGAKALGSLAAARTGKPLACGGCSSSTLPAGTALPATCQPFADHVSTLCSDASAVPSYVSCLADVLKSDDTLHGCDLTTVRPYCADRVNVVKNRHRAIRLEPLVGDSLLEVLDQPEKFILRSDAADVEMSEGQQIYIGPLLKEPAVLLELIRKLKKLGLVVFRRARKCSVGVFTVARKLNKLRLVLDCRQTNALCRDAPRTYLSTPAALSLTSE